MSITFDSSPQHAAILAGAHRGRVLRALSVHAFLAFIWRMLRRLLEGKDHAVGLHQMMHLSEYHLRDIGLTPAEISQVRLLRGDLPFMR